MKNQTLKPIEVDAQFKYRCVNPECGNEYWLFLNQVKVKGFKIVCDCGVVYQPKRISGLIIKYSKKKKKQTKNTTDEKQPLRTNKTFIDKACKVLENYGFSDKEAKDLVNRVYDITQCENPILLVKDALKIFGGM